MEIYDRWEDYEVLGFTELMNIFDEAERWVSELGQDREVFNYRVVRMESDCDNLSRDLVH